MIKFINRMNLVEICYMEMYNSIHTKRYGYKGGLSNEKS